MRDRALMVQKSLLDGVEGDGDLWIRVMLWAHAELRSKRGVRLLCTCDPRSRANAPAARPGLGLGCFWGEGWVGARGTFRDHVPMRACGFALFFFCVWLSVRALCTGVTFREALTVKSWTT